ncbi:LPXTG cell wall anchor domain-containing protein [Capnocytophaga cynodegmi]|uniref:LPXTG cell wall anchor domain-containing protein n=1 Tax=Capnocytophaga cynodegmi TaxID=28189 RepID=UPI001BB2F784|nr:LPXTG cell wall anchor domain-containing protein [Capnocytophaga cynodegmi]
MNARIFFEYAYLAVCAVSIYLAVEYWQTEQKQSFYLYIAFAIASLAMFFLRRKNRKRNERKDNS